MLQKLDLSGRLVNWAVELGQFDIEFHPRKTIKGQALADFLVEMSSVPEAEELPKDSTWIAYVDGSSTSDRSGAGVSLLGPNKERFDYVIKLDFITISNEAEYEVVLASLTIAREMRISSLEIQSDSQVVVGQISGGFAAQEDRMIKYLDKVRQFQSCFDIITLTKVPREENNRADALSRIGSGTEQGFQVGKYEVLIRTESFISPQVEVMQVEEAEPEWATVIIQYLKQGVLP